MPEEPEAGVAQKVPDRSFSPWLLASGALVIAAGVVVMLVMLLPGPSEPKSYGGGTATGVTEPAASGAAAADTGRRTAAPELAGVTGEPREQWAIPNPDTTQMQDAVREQLVDARADVVSQPRSAAAWGSFGAVLDAHKIYADAEACYRRALALDPTLFLYSYFLAIVLDAQGQGSDELITLYKRARELAPKYAPISWRLGDALVRQGRYADAREAFLVAVEVDPELAMAHRSLGQVLLTLSDPEAALTHLERAAELTPNDGGVYQALARVYMAIGDRPRADEAAEKSRTYEHEYRLPDLVVDRMSALAVSSSTAYRRAKSLIAAGDYTGAIPDLLTVEKTRPNDPIIKVFLAEAYRRTGYLEEAELRLSDALRLNPGAVSAYMEYARLKLGQGELDEAIAFFREAADLAPEHATVNTELGLTLVRKRDYYGAVAAFECASGERELTADVHVNWGFALRKTDRLNAALEHLHKAIAISPQYADAHAQLGVALAENGESEQAFVHIRRAAELNPNHPIVRRMNRTAP